MTSYNICTRCNIQSVYVQKLSKVSRFKNTRQVKVNLGPRGKELRVTLS